MGKVYKDKNVLQAAFERLEIIFTHFQHVYFSISGGKDSSVMVQLAAIVARKMGVTFSVLYIDLEAQYQETEHHILEIKEDYQDVMDQFYWVCLPLSLRNAVSIIQPKWICWNEPEKDKWVRDMPEECIHLHNYPTEWTWFKEGMEFEDFILYFAKWYSESFGSAAAGIGIRTDESFNRFRTIISEKKERFLDYGWTTRVKMGNDPLDVFNFYPIYDWHVEDIWTAVAKLNLKYNYIYELMYKNGLPIHEQRLCQPYGDDQRNGLDQFRALEPETWEKVLNRVHGVNFGSIYARTSLLGNITSEKPAHMTWEQYAVFLLESLGLYAPEVRDHYYKKIKKFFSWWEKQRNITMDMVVDEADKSIEAKRKQPTWRRVARAIEKNDFWMKRLTFSPNKSDVKKLEDLKEKYRNIIRPDATDDKHLREWSERMEVNNGRP
ncbi:DUF3440 domain-containing protein [Paenibacillus larvae]|uniref:Putative phosphoadenosine phosphosulfate sulfotransferase n=1 Tax=Paenibacillus larvae subsp. larvae TaxID=147375 RepID=A0A2L1U7M6_9BACL|nr:DUF3440 domain-containing protein [Paenibacillus larvae]AVF28868.1 putative phosphoadenosine phosphosulfate sulfotransferase [Paenibacillus larvae subsp. larvae]MCY9502429.1 DUF3440 domain-containing protein [Paenibacillus larvae]MDR5608763.1 DUF3440 domain-containing protein [Paenibacillus larvae]